MNNFSDRNSSSNFSSLEGFVGEESSRNLYDGVVPTGMRHKRCSEQNSTSLPRSTPDDFSYVDEFISIVKADMVKSFGTGLGFVFQIDPKYFVMKSGESRFMEFLNAFCNDEWFKKNTLVVVPDGGIRFGKFNICFLREKSLLERKKYCSKMFGTESVSLYSVSDFHAVLCMGVYCIARKVEESLT